MDLESEIIDVDDSDVEFIGEEQVHSTPAPSQTPSASAAASPTANKNTKNKQQLQTQQQQPVEAMDTEDILPKTNQS